MSNNKDKCAPKLLMVLDDVADTNVINGVNPIFINGRHHAFFPIITKQKIKSLTDEDEGKDADELFSKWNKLGYSEDELYYEIISGKYRFDTQLRDEKIKEWEFIRRRRKNILQQLQNAFTNDEVTVPKTI